MEHPNDKMPGSEMMIYITEDGLTKIETTFDGDTVWLSADQMAELFQRDKSTISRHIKDVYKRQSPRSSGNAVWRLGKTIICRRRTMPKCRSAHRKRKRRLWRR